MLTWYINVELNTARYKNLNPGSFLSNNDISTTGSCINIGFSSGEMKVFIHASPCLSMIFQDVDIAVTDTEVWKNLWEIQIRSTVALVAAFWATEQKHPILATWFFWGVFLNDLWGHKNAFAHSDQHIWELEENGKCDLQIFFYCSYYRFLRYEFKFWTAEFINL